MASYNDTKKEKEIHFKSELERLRIEPLQESSGKMIGNLIQYKPSRALLVYARRWLKQFPDHEYAPNLVGHWLEKYDSNQAMSMADYYIRNFSPTFKLRGLLRGIGSNKRSPQRIYNLIEARLEKEPDQDAWACLQKFEAKNNRKSEKVILRWLELNRSNSNQDIIVSSVALFTESVEIIESAMQWAETVWNGKGYWFVLSHLMRGRSDAHALLRPRIMSLTKRWIEDHGDDLNCGRVYGDLISIGRDPEDIRLGKIWFIEHESNESAQWVLIGLLRASKELAQEPDMFIVDKIKPLLRNRTPAQRMPVMVEVLLDAYPDVDSIAFARQIPGLIGKVLRLAPDDKLIANAKEILANGCNVVLEHDLILELLKLNPGDEALRKDARRWIRKHGKKFPDQELMKPWKTK